MHSCLTLNPLGPRPAAALSLQNLVQREVTVKWSSYETLKVNNKHQIKVSADFVVFPVCKYIVLVYIQQVLFYFIFLLKTIFKKSKIRRVTDLPNFLVWFSKDDTPWLCLGKQLSKIYSWNIEGWSSDTIANSFFFFFSFFFHVSIVCPSCNFENSNSQTPPNFEQRTLLEVMHNSRNEATSLMRIPFLFV